MDLSLSGEAIGVPVVGTAISIQWSVDPGICAKSHLHPLPRSSEGGGIAPPGTSGEGEARGPLLPLAGFADNKVGAGRFGVCRSRGVASCVGPGGGSGCWDIVLVQGLDRPRRGPGKVGDG